MGQRRHVRFAPYGVVRDLSSQISNGEVWSEAYGVRFRNLRTEPNESYQYRTPMPRYDPSRLWFRDFDGAFHWFYSSASGIGLNVGTADYDVTPVGWTGVSIGRESWASLNSIPVYNHPERTPLYHGGDPNVAMADLPNWPAGWSCTAMRAYKFYLLAMDVTDPTDHYENQVRWSAAADPGNVPSEWTPSATNDARSLTLGDISGRIIDGMTLGDEFMVYKGSSTYAMRYIGGVWVMRQRTLFRELGILAKDCVAEWEGKHFLVGEGDIVIHDGVTVASIADKQVRRAIFDDMDITTYGSRSFAYHDPNSNQFVFYWPGKDAVKFCNRRAVYTNSDKRWSVETVTPEEVSHAKVGTYARTVGGNTWADPAGVKWSEDYGRWNDGLDQSTGDTVMLGFGNAVQLGEQVNSGGHNGVPIQSNLKLLHQDLGRPDRAKLIDRVSLEGHASMPVDVRVRVGSSDHPAAPVIWGRTQTTQLGIGGALPSVQPLVKGRFVSLDLEVETSSSWHLDAVHVGYREQGRWA